MYLNTFMLSSVFLLLELKRTSYPEMTIIFYKGNYQLHRIIQKRLYDPTPYC